MVENGAATTDSNCKLAMLAGNYGGGVTVLEREERGRRPGERGKKVGGGDMLEDTAWSKEFANYKLFDLSELRSGSLLRELL
ncbi:hypothetical protein OROHE_006228 [Orobanche hederae]